MTNNKLQEIIVGRANKITIQNFLDIKYLEMDFTNIRIAYLAQDSENCSVLPLNILRCFVIGLQSGYLNSIHGIDKTKVVPLLSFIQKNFTDTSSINVSTDVGEFELVNFNTGGVIPYMSNVFGYINPCAQAMYMDNTYGCLSLFSDQATMIGPVVYIKELDRLLQYDGRCGALIQMIIDAVKKIFNIKIHIGEEIMFEKDSKLLTFEQLPEHIKAQMSWLSDLLYRLGTNQPHVDKPINYKGLVLLESLDANFSDSLCDLFSNMQFIFAVPEYKKESTLISQPNNTIELTYTGIK